MSNVAIFSACAILVAIPFIFWFVLKGKSPKEIRRILFYSETSRSILMVLALVSLFGNLRIREAKNLLETERLRLGTCEENIRTHLSWAVRYYCDSRFVRTGSSPTNFDEIIRQFSAVCEHVRSAENVIIEKGLTPESLETIDPNRIRLESCQPCIMHANDFQSIYSSYVATAQGVKELEAKSHESALELTLVILWPLLFAATIGLTLAKTLLDREINLKS